LRRRAQELASRITVAEEVEALGQFVVARRGGARFGVPVAAVEELRWVAVTVIPHSTEVINGVFHVRGQVFSLIDIAPIFGESFAALENSDHALVMLVAGARGLVGIRVDEVIGSREVAVNEVDHGFQGGTVDFVTRVLTDAVALIDIDVLLSHPAVRISRQL
jgi:chemotaxis signal transduction protein